jgi:molybdopterin/thiamine biosynthesis adenylyltransferase
VRLTGDNARALVAGYDVVLDGTDDFVARGAVNEACVAEERPLVSGAVARWSGQVGVFSGRPCWRCLVPADPPEAETCAAVGVAGPLTAAIGGLMALEAAKLIMGAGRPLLGRLLLYDGLSGEARPPGSPPTLPVASAAEPKEASEVRPDRRVSHGAQLIVWSGRGASVPLGERRPAPS